MECAKAPSCSQGPLKIRWAYGTGPAQEMSTKKRSSSSPSEDQKDGHRQRRTHQKVRTGCLTCKARRKKCDETKPACQRCTSTGRLCEGYPEPQPSKDTTSAELSYPTPTSQSNNIRSYASTPSTSLIFPRGNQLSRSPDYYSSLVSVSDVDRQCFSYFLLNTFPQFTSYFDSPLWRSRLMIGIGTNNPALFYAAVALAAVHQRFNYGISREAFELCAHVDRLHKKALCELAIWKQQHIGSHDVYYHQISMMSEMLLSVFELFQDEPEASNQHTTSSIEHLIQSCLLTPVRKERRYCPRISKSRVFGKLLYQLYCHVSELFESPINILAKGIHGQSLPPVPYTFDSLEEARDFLFTEIDWVILSPARWQDFDDRQMAQNVHATRLRDWGHAYTRMIEEAARTPRQQRACAFMKLARNAIYLLTFSIFFVDLTIHNPIPLAPFEPDSDDKIEPKVSNITNLLWQLSQSPRTLDQNLASIKKLLEPLCFDDTVWNMHNAEHGASNTINQCQSSSPTSYHCKVPQIGIYAVANRISADGETAMANALQGKLPMFKVCGWTDVSYMLEDEFLLIRYYERLEGRVGYWFTQEWWKL